MRTAVIGGGAAGMAAAIAAAERGERVTVLERNAKPLKKLGVTGNGRCNLLNVGTPVYYGDEAFARGTLARVPVSTLRVFFEGIGVPLREESEGRVYPAALSASVVTDALRLRARQLNVVTRAGARVLALDRLAEGGFVLRAEADELRADRVIVCAGGAAAPAHGTDGSAYALLTALGHTLVPPRPALCAIRAEKKALEGLAGQRMRARLTLADGRQTAGEVLFGEDAVSGIAAMQLARFVASGDSLTLDLRPALCFEGDERALYERLQALANRREGMNAGDLLTGWFAVPVGRALLRHCGLAAGAPMPRDAALRRVARAICGWTLTVTGTRGFDQAQVTAGGIPPREFDPDTLQSRLCPGLYAAGEVLDVDGDCGGFNLMFAFASGLLAGRGAKGERA